MALEFQVLSRPDIDEIQNYSQNRLAREVTDETERRLASWSVKWRREALEHYLPLGWSFVARERHETKGYFLAQPLLFFRGQTQTLWLEHLEGDSRDVRVALVDLASRVAREKHLQRLLILDPLLDELDALRPELLKPEFITQEIDNIAEVKTTKG